MTCVRERHDEDKSKKDKTVRHPLAASIPTTGDAEQSLLHVPLVRAVRFEFFDNFPSCAVSFWQACLTGKNWG